MYGCMKKSLKENNQLLHSCNYIPKSQKVMTVSGLKFDLLHINAMDFSESMQNVFCIHGRNILLACMHVEFFDIQNALLMDDNNLGRLAKLKTVQHVIVEVMQPLT